jgi:murein DD-endopeptidase
MKRILAPMSRIAEWEPPIPRQHLYAILMLAGFSVASITLLPSPNELLADNPISVQSEDLSADANIAGSQAADTEFLTIPDHELVGNEASAVDGLEEDSAPEPQWVDYQVKGDDNLSVIFNTLNLPAKTLHKLLEVDIQNSLIRLKINQKLSFMVDTNNVLQQLAIPLDGERRVLFERQGDNYVSRVEPVSGDAAKFVSNTADDNEEVTKPQSSVNTKSDAKPDLKTAKVDSKQKEVAVAPPSRVIKGSISGAFVTSARNAGLTNNQIHKVANMFRGRIDFRRDLRRGDNFRVLFDKPHDDDAKILAVTFTINGRSMNAFRSTDGQFYDESASSFSGGGTFMRFPIPSQRRVSSGFSPSRRNPVTGRIQPHNGTDFSVHVGTPILATGDGVVIKATSHRDAGRYVIIRHGGRYSTTYMHMSKLLVKPGQKVKQGQKIGLSGNTGRSTGPHLHYEFRINDRPVDAMRVDLPMNEGMGGKDKRQFLAKVREYKRLINQG